MGVYLWQDVPVITTPWIYHSPSLWLISLSANWTSRVTMADKNLWATTVYNPWDTLSEANCGKFYQWGNNYWFPFSWSVTTSSTQVNANSYWPWNYYSSSTFITRSSSPYRWDSWNNSNLWGWTTWTNAAMQWPCNEWFHIPSLTDLNTLYNTYIWLWFSWWNNFINYLKVPISWLRKDTDASVLTQDVRWWSSTVYDTDSANCLLIATYWQKPITIGGWQYRAGWIHIRPFKNEAVQPDTSWTKLN